MTKGLQDLLDSCPVSYEGDIQCVTIPVSLLIAEIEVARQLAEQRAELLEALQLVRSYVVTMKGTGHEYQKAIDAAIANATQQRNATGGEG